MKYKICQMQENDISEVIDFHNKYLGTRDFINKKEISNRLKSNNGIFFVAKDEKGKIIGIKLGYIENDTCIGRGIAVDKRYRRLGIGKELVKNFEDRLKSFPSVKKYIFASSTQEGIPFHIKLGYKPSVLLQSNNKELLESINLEEFTLKGKSYNKVYNVHQIYLEPDQEPDLSYLSQIKSRCSGIDIQYLFEKDF
ncbi:MAG TPA: GNAT family N-acetyltransferase [Candidatus Dojkabacteria bacterium]|nr:GNAT family N-acetyltransferase [Candidatus Dojkabacteria bacterium]